MNNVVVKGGSSIRVWVRRLAVPFLVVVGVLGFSGGADAAGSDDFVTTWDTTNSGTSDNSSITIPAVSGGYAYQVDWNNDGDLDDADEAIVHTGVATHSYAIPGVHTIRISGSFPRLRFDGGGDSQKILSVDQWGTQSWDTMANAFLGCTNLTVPATDTPDFSGLDNLSGMFRNTVVADPDVSGWDTSTVKYFDGMFWSAAANPDVSSWNTSNAISFRTMFRSAPNALPDVSNWDTQNLVDTRSMFNASPANPDVSNWNTLNLSFAGSMFAFASNAEPDVSNWNTSSLTTIGSMFWRSGASLDVSNWDTSLVTEMSMAFGYLSDPNLDVSNWDTSSATNMRQMFQGNTSNPDVTNWDTQNVTTLNSMFELSPNFDRDLSGWDLSNVTDMAEFLAGSELSAVNYDAALTAWSVQSLQPNLVLDAGASSYCISGAERQALLDNLTWTIVDSGEDCTPSVPGSPVDLLDVDDAGSSTTDDVTTSSSPSVSVQCSVAGNEVRVYSDLPTPNSIVATLTCTQAQAENVQLANLPEGVHQLTYSEVRVGLESGRSGALVLEIDRSAPAVPTCVATPALAGPNALVLVSCSGVEVGGAIAIDNMICTPDQATVLETIDCSGTTNSNADGATGNVDTSNDAVVISDPAGNEAELVTGLVVDVSPPIVVLVGPSELSLAFGTVFVDPGASCADDRDATCAAVVDGTLVDSGNIGTYVLTYSAVDSLGNVADSVVRTVIIRAPVTTTTAIQSASTIQPSTTQPSSETTTTTQPSAPPVSRVGGDSIATSSTIESDQRPVASTGVSTTSQTTGSTEAALGAPLVPEEDLSGVSDAAFVDEDQSCDCWDPRLLIVTFFAGLLTCWLLFMTRGRRQSA